MSKVVPALQFLLEGQEEIGSPNMADLLQEHRDLLRADIALSADGGQISPKHVSHASLAADPNLTPWVHAADMLSMGVVVWQPDTAPHTLMLDCADLMCDCSLVSLWGCGVLWHLRWRHRL